MGSDEVSSLVKIMLKGGLSSRVQYFVRVVEEEESIELREILICELCWIFSVHKVDPIAWATLGHGGHCRFDGVVAETCGHRIDENIGDVHC
jgi:hypothetical protein